MFPKIQGLMNNFMVQPIGTVTSRGAQGVEGAGQNPSASAVTKGFDQYAQYDNKLESGHSGASQRMNQAGYDGYNKFICLA